MELGVSFTLLVVLGVALALGLCILLKCYHMKREKALRDNLGIEDEEMMSEELVVGAYEQFRLKRERQRKMLSDKQNASHIELDLLAERPAMGKIIDLDNDIYGISSLKKRIQIDTTPFNRTLTSASTLRQSAFSKIGRTPGAGNFISQTFKFIQQLVCYSEDGIIVTEVTPEKVTRGRAGISIDGTVKEMRYDNETVECYEWCEICGFEEGSYGWCKYVCEVEVGGVRQGDGAQWKNMSHSVNKLAIEKEQWERARREIKAEYQFQKLQT